MARVLQIRQGNNAENNIFKGALAELTYDSTNKDIRIHDGEQRGGFIIPSLDSFQMPSASNGYRWFRRYSNGWCEQGGTTDVSNGSGSTITLTKPMLDGNYQVFLQASNAAGYQSYWVVRTGPTSSNFVVHSDYTGATRIFWEVKGMWK